MMRKKRNRLRRRLKETRWRNSRRNMCANPSVSTPAFKFYMAQKVLSLVTAYDTLMMHFTPLIWVLLIILTIDLVNTLDCAILWLSRVTRVTCFKLDIAPRLQSSVTIMSIQRWYTFYCAASIKWRYVIRYRQVGLTLESSGRMRKVESCHTSLPFSSSIQW